ncbi:signal peptide peptidase SppA [Candidatus Kaiserbacteria bacterium]|nr:MAG: signal peptide peptidase SppA [Candidatus Kaiserbacteria bacterium]
MKTQIIQVVKFVGAVVLVAILIPTIFYVSLLLWGDWHDEWSGYNAGWYISDGQCNIAVIPIDGEITTFPYELGGEEEGDPPSLSTSMTDTLSLLNTAENYDPNIQGILMLIDSGGGSPSASKMIADELKGSTLPVAAFILDYAASGGYYVATGADTIIANPFSDVGSIGITMSYLDYSKQNAEQGLEYVSLSSGKFKDSGTPDRALTAEERALFERDLKIYHDTFVKEVAQNRNLPVEDVAKLADGSTLPAPLALEAKLIDQIGGKEDARAWFAEQLGMNVEDVVLCQ